METIIHELTPHDWARPLIDNINRNGGVTRQNKALLFELRFAYNLHQNEILCRYEVEGEGESTVDFGFVSQDQSWFVELMRLEETVAAQEATQTWTNEDGIPWFKKILSSAADNNRHSEEGETLKAVERICQKCEKDGRPHKFRLLDDGFNVILVDFRTFLNGGDDADKVHIGLGGEFLRHPFFKRFWEGRLISGVFNEQTCVRGAREARERIHFIGFVNEQEYDLEEFGNSTRFIANPFLFQDVGKMRATIDTWPLQPAIVLNN